MKNIKEQFKAQIQIKKSIFIAYLCPFDEFKNTLSILKQEHSKAKHFVYAYRYLNDLNQICEDKSDDKEPKGVCLGALNVLRKLKLINTAVIIVRYFGGIKLGINALTRAYTEATSVVSSQAFIFDFFLKNEFYLDIKLKELAFLKHFFLKNDFEFSIIFEDDKALIKLKLTQAEEEILRNFLVKENLGLLRF